MTMNPTKSGIFSLLEKAGLQRLLLFLFLLSVFLLALNKVEDPDAWTHFSLGKVIYELKGFPKTEPFLYSTPDAPFGYSSWLFGLIYYMAYNLSGLYGVILLKALTVTLAFGILVSDSIKPYRNSTVAVLVLTSIVLISRHRFVERPDTFLMIFLPFTVFALNSYMYEGRKYLYAMPFISIIWANMHPSITLMSVPFVAFIGGIIIEGVINKKRGLFKESPSREVGNPERCLIPEQVRNDRTCDMAFRRQLITITAVFALSLICSLASPYSFSQFTSSSGVLSSDWWTQEIIELKKPTWELTKAPYMLTFILASSFALNYRRVSFTHFLLALPFVYLSFTALRFVFVFAIIAGPLIARNLSCFLDEPESLRFLRHKIFQGAVILWIVAYAVLTVAAVEPFGDPEKAFGFGANYFYEPEGALAYMDKRGIEGKVFNQFHFGGYITWRDFPKRRAFVDGRGLASQDLLERAERARMNELVMDALEKTYGFDAILIQPPIFKESSPEVFGEQDAALMSSNWALVYWDDSSLLYLKRGGRYEAVIRTDEYRFVLPSNGEYGLKKRLQDEISKQGLIADLLRNIRETGSSRGYALLGQAHNFAGEYKDAVEMFSKVQKNMRFSHIITAYNGIAFAYYRLGNYDAAVSFYKRALELERNSATLYNFALVYIQKGDRTVAIKYLKEALDANPNFLNSYLLLLSLYKELGMNDEVRKTEQAYLNAMSYDKAEMHFKKGADAYINGRFKEALDEYNKSIQINPSNPAPYCNIGFIYFDINNYEKALEYHKKAVEINRSFANSYYGMALVYRNLGQAALAKENWQEYLRLEPEGYYSRRAKEELVKTYRKQHR